MALDTERAARRLTDAGMEERAANGVADVMADATDGLATEAGLERLEARMDARFAESEGRVDTRFAESEGRLDARIAEWETRMIKWTVAAVVGGMTAAAAIARLIGG